jgi:nitrogen fixation protein FixH
MTSRAVEPKSAREVTGRTVLVCFVGFFGIVATVNAIMMYAAITTFAGTETSSSYKAGLAYKQEAAAAAAQEALNWQVDGRIVRTSSGEAVLTVSVKDTRQAPVNGIDIAARLTHPLNARFDHSIPLVRTMNGDFRGATEAAAGQWTLIIEVARADERVYRTKSRVVLQ